MAAAILANLNEEQLLAGTADEKINRLLLLVRDGFKDLKDQLSAANVEIATLKSENVNLKTEINNLKNKQANEQVLSEYHSKKYNMIIHNLPEVITGNAWESNIESIEKVYNFFSNDLKVDNARKMQLMNAHRIGNPKTIVDQTTKKSLRTRPLIVQNINVVL